MQTLRDLAIQRAANAEIAKYSVMNVAYGINALESHLHGSSLRKATYAETGTKRSYEVKLLWHKAIKQVLSLNIPADIKRYTSFAVASSVVDLFYYKSESSTQGRRTRTRKQAQPIQHLNSTVSRIAQRHLHKNLC